MYEQISVHKGTEKNRWKIKLKNVYRQMGIPRVGNKQIQKGRQKEREIDRYVIRQKDRYIDI